MNKGKLAILLSKLDDIKEKSADLEQYNTPSEIAADVLWFMFVTNDIKGKVIADLGCGNGILGFGALVLGAKKVYFVDKDKKLLNVARKNVEKFKFLSRSEFFNLDVKNFNKKVDVVIENPPFGVQKEHADRIFLEKAAEITDIIYSFHKIESEEFIKKFLPSFNIKKVIEFDFPLKKTQYFHKKNKYLVKVGVWRIIKEKNL